MWLRNTGHSVVTTVASISRVLNILGIAVLGIMTCLTVADVLGRYLFRQPVVGTTELTEYMMVCIVFLGLAWCAVKGRHVRVDLVLMHLKPTVQATLYSITHFVSFGVLIIVAWRATLESIAMQNSPKESALLHIPAYPFYWAMTVGIIVLCLVMVSQLVQSVAKAVKR